MRILGHEAIEKELAASISSGRIFPTWIFCGPYGVGKSSVARSFAKCLLADKVGSNCLEINDPVNKLVDARTHPDFFILEQTSENVSIDEIRELMGKIRKKPSLSKRRVVLIENTSYFNKNIYNSMLKILEEPPENTVIIMICQNLGYIPRTLLSRAAKINFNPLSDADVEAVLQQAGISNTKDLTKLADGSPGYAVYLNDHDGVNAFKAILSVLESTDGKRKLDKLINDSEMFRMLKDLLIKLFGLYVETLTNTIDEIKYASEVAIFRKMIDRKRPDVNAEAQKALDAISLLNKAESLMLDKPATLMCAFDKLM